MRRHAERANGLGVAPLLEIIGDQRYYEKILAALPADGTFRTNREVREELGLPEDEYWRVRDQLVNEGKIIKARGRGGSVAIAAPTDEGGVSSVHSPVTKKEIKKAAQQEATKAEKEKREEYALYDPFKNSIEKRARDEGADGAVVEITARQGRRQTGGEWSRPDVCQVSLRKLKYLGQRVVEVTTYEIKTLECDVSAVYEALSHSRRAHRSYLAIHVPIADAADNQDRMERIKVECARSGVGLLLFADPGDLDTFRTLVEPRANWVDLSEVDEFISTQITDKEKVRDWTS